MVVALIGESCVGKSTLAGLLRERCGAQIYAGKDYLRLSKSAPEARRAFAALLAGAEAPMVYVVSEADQLALLPDHCTRVLMTAPLDVIKERFARRMGGSLPPPVAGMLERKHGLFDDTRRDISLAHGECDPAAACEEIARRMEKHVG